MIAEQLVYFRVLLGGDQGGFQAGCSAAGKSTLHLTHTPLDARQRLAQLFLCSLLQEVNTQIEGDGVETAGKDNACAALFGRLTMCIDHLAHPRGLTAEVNIVSSGSGANGNQFGAV